MADVTFPSINLTWDGVADNNVAQQTGPDVFDGDAGSFNRILAPITYFQSQLPPWVSLVPPGPYVLLSELSLPDGSKVTERLKFNIGQAVQLIWTQEAVDSLAQTVAYEGQDIVEGFATYGEFLDLQQGIIGNLTLNYTGVNISFHTDDDLTKPFNEVHFKDLDPANEAHGRGTLDWGNADPNNLSDVFVGMIKKSFRTLCLIADLEGDEVPNLPVGFSELSKPISKTATHEVGHNLGLLRDPVLDEFDAHNSSPTMDKFMDPGRSGSDDRNNVEKFQDLRSSNRSFRPLNFDYLLFVLP